MGVGVQLGRARCCPLHLYGQSSPQRSLYQPLATIWAALGTPLTRKWRVMEGERCAQGHTAVGLGAGPERRASNPKSATLATAWRAEEREGARVAAEKRAPTPPASPPSLMTPATQEDAWAVKAWRWTAPGQCCQNRTAPCPFLPHKTEM